MVIGKLMRHEGDKDADDEMLNVWHATMDEVAKGHLEGPFEEEAIDNQFGANSWIAIRRFTVLQKDKLRPIDDMTRSMVNATVQTFEKVQPQGIDVISVWASELKAKLHAANPANRRRLVGKDA